MRNRQYRFFTRSACVGLFVLCCCALARTHTARADAPPYPPSPVIAELTWAPTSSIQRAAHNSDNFPLTWADDHHLYTAYGDGRGFEPNVPDKLSLGFARISGSPSDFRGENIRSSAEQYGNGSSGKKASGLLMVDGVLYMWVRNANQDGEQCQLAWSTDQAQTWTWSDWTFAQFGYCTFINYGQNYAGARDNYVYMVSHDYPSAYDPGDAFVLTRVPKEQMANRSAYEFFVHTDADGNPVWTADVAARGPVFSHAGRARRSGITYNAVLGRYLWWQGIPHSGDERYGGGFGVYDAPEPWGPWTTVYYTEDWDVGPGETGSFPTKWMSDDGLTLHLVFSGDDYFSVRQAALTLREGAPPTDTPPTDTSPPDSEPQPPPLSPVRTIQVAVMMGADDAEESADGIIDLTSDDLDMAQNNGNLSVVGIRFQQVNIPRGARILRARIEFTPNGENRSETTLHMAGEDVGQTAAFQRQENDISGRARTDATVSWMEVPAWDAVQGESMATPNVAPIVQELVLRNDWRASNPMTFIVTGTGRRSAVSYNNQADAAPRLYVEFTHAIHLPIAVR